MRTESCGSAVGASDRFGSLSQFESRAFILQANTERREGPESERLLDGSVSDDEEDVLNVAQEKKLKKYYHGIVFLCDARSRNI